VIIAAVALSASLVLGKGLPTSAPRTVGMSADRLATVDRVVRRGITAGAYPGAAVVVGRKGYAVWQKGYGRLSWTSTSAAVDATETIYDLASLTKVIATTTAAMILYDEGKLDLQAPVQRYLPEFTGDMKELVTVEHLLTHRSGLPPGRQLWKTARTPAEARQALTETAAALRGLNLNLHPRKTCLTSFEAGFRFLGVDFKGDTYEYVCAQKRIKVQGATTRLLYDYRPEYY